MTDTKPTLEEQIEWAEVLIGCDSGIAPAVLASLKELQSIKEQEPVAWGVFSPEFGSVYIADYELAAQEHINEAINEHDFLDAAKWFVRPLYTTPPSERRLALEEAAKVCEGRAGHPSMGAHRILTSAADIKEQPVPVPVEPDVLRLRNGFFCNSDGSNTPTYGQYVKKDDYDALKLDLQAAQQENEQLREIIENSGLDADELLREVGK